MQKQLLSSVRPQIFAFSRWHATVAFIELAACSIQSAVIFLDACERHSIL